MLCGTLGVAIAGSGTPSGTLGAFLIAVAAAAALRLASPGWAAQASRT